MRGWKTVAALVGLALAAPLAATTHTVRSGESLSGIARAHGVSVAELARANGITDPDRIYAGQRIVIGGGDGDAAPARTAPTAPTVATYLVRRGDTLTAIAAEHGTSVAAIAQRNGITDIHRVYAGTTLRLPDGRTGGGRGGVAAPATTVHVVRAGENLHGIARRYGTTAVEVASANGIRNPHLIRIGQRLRIPHRGGAAPAAGPAAEAFPARLRAHPERLALVPIFDRWAAHYGVPHDLLKAMTYLESGWQNRVTSSTGAQGIGQLMPDTVRFVSRSLIGADLDPANPSDNIRMSARFLKYLLDENGGDVSMALASYYQGLAAVRRKGVYPQTQAYVAGVLALRSRFSWSQ